MDGLTSLYKLYDETFALFNEVFDMINDIFETSKIKLKEKETSEIETLSQFQNKLTNYFK